MSTSLASTPPNLINRSFFMNKPDILKDLGIGFDDVTPVYTEKQIQDVRQDAYINVIDALTNKIRFELLQCFGLNVSSLD